jgi:hypothetical protein
VLVASNDDDNHDSHDGSRENSLAEALENVDSIIRQLIRISIAIRKSGADARLERADNSFDPSRHVELRLHLSVLILIWSLLKKDPEAGNSQLDVSSPALSPIQERLVDANLRRRHRFLYARRRWSKQMQERGDRRTGTPSHSVDPPTLPLISSDAGQDADQSHERVGRPETDQPLVFIQDGFQRTGNNTSTTPTALEGPIIIPPGSQPSLTVASSTSSRVVYPRPPKIQDGQNVFRCPCCYQSLPVGYSRGTRWR